MTTKEAIHEKIERLDENRAKLILEHVNDLLDESDDVAQSFDSLSQSTDGGFAETWSSIREARLALIGMARSAQPTNIAEHKDEYIADAILHRDEPDH